MTKQITQESSPEQAKYFCDKHPDRECFSELKTVSWYGSKFDMCGLEIHLCDDCLFEMYTLLKDRFGIEPNELDI
jgi:hypothetical protein